jgi:hypothetical protein
MLLWLVRRVMSAVTLVLPSGEKADMTFLTVNKSQAVWLIVVGVVCQPKWHIG